MLNFWNELPKGSMCLAPMENVTDTVFREIVLRRSDLPGRLKVLFTEFTNVDGICHPKGAAEVNQRLRVNDSENNLLKKGNVKLVAQIWGNNPDLFWRTAAIIEKMGLFDGIDINMGCPVKKVVKKNTCSALIKFPKLAQEIISATKSNCNLPVSVKTRLGFNNIVTENWIGQLVEASPAAIILHGRTQKQQSDGIADWNEIKKAAKLCKSLAHPIPLIGNGDIRSINQALEYIHGSDIDGAMVGRGIFTNVDIFGKENYTPSFIEKTNLLKDHILLYDKTWGTHKNFNVLKRFFKIYINGFKGASHIRCELMKTVSASTALTLIDRFQKEYVIKDTMTSVH